MGKKNNNDILQWKFFNSNSNHLNPPQKRLFEFFFNIYTSDYHVTSKSISFSACLSLYLIIWLNFVINKTVDWYILYGNNSLETNLEFLTNSDFLKSPNLSHLITMGYDELVEIPIMGIIVLMRSWKLLWTVTFWNRQTSFI